MSKIQPQVPGPSPEGGHEGAPLLDMKAHGEEIILRNAFRARHWKQLALLAVPVFAVALLVGYILLLAEASAQRNPQGTPEAPFTTLALILQFGLVILFLVAVVGSTFAIALAVKQSRLSDGLVRFGLIPAAAVTFGIVVGLVTTIIFNMLLLAEAPQLQSSPGNLIIVMLFMVGAAAVAIVALWNGWRATNTITA